VKKDRFFIKKRLPTCSRSL